MGIELVGEGNVNWTETRTVYRDGESHSETVFFWNHETYVKQERVLHEGPGLPPGSHYFPFSFMLPPKIPSTFESDIGNVRYFIKAAIVRSWKWNHKVKQHFMVNGILDLNTYPSAKEEGHSRKHKRLCCLCCKSGPITAEITSNRAGYVPGEMIGFNAEVENLSNRMMEGSFLNLVEIVEYRAAGDIRTAKRVVTKVERGEILPGNSDCWEGVSIRVPALPPTNLGGNCSIIDVQYRLEFHVDPCGWAFDLVVKIPIIIGTIPLQQYIPTFVAPPPPPPMPLRPAMTVSRLRVLPRLWDNSSC